MGRGCDHSSLTYDSGVLRKTQVPEEEGDRFPGGSESWSFFCTAHPPLHPRETETLSAGQLQCYGLVVEGGDGGGVNRVEV